MKSFVNRDDSYACLNYFSQICIYLCSLMVVLSTPSYAEDFTAHTLSDQGNITVMEVTGNYDAKKADGSYNDAPRQVIAKEFLRTHKDEYDFLVIYSNFDFQMPTTEAKAFYLSVKNDTKGIGQQLFDNSTLFGSNGKLQGMVDMGNVSNIIADPLNPKFEDTLFLLSHEIMHRWGAYVKFKDANGNISSALLGRDLNHWSYLLSGYGSVLYGNQWQDNGNGTFTSIANMKYYSPLDLYLMGLYSKTQVPPMLLIADPGIDPAKIPQTGDIINGTLQYVTIDDIVAAEGERIPASSEAQKTFKTAFIFITAPGTFTGDELYGIEGIRNGWVSRFSILTDGKAIVSVDSAPAENVPSNPGTVTPTVIPRTLPPNIEDGVNWLMTSQQADGSWMDLSLTSERDTAESVLVLKNFSNALQNYSTGIQWLNGTTSGNMDYLCRKIEALANPGQDVTSLVNELVTRQNPDGGWGSDKGYLSNPGDASLALKALSKTGYSGQGAISKAIEYLKASQNADKGWGGDDGESTVETTANVLSAFNKYNNVYQLSEIVSGGIALLLQRQNPDGGFGNSPSTVYDTAIAVSVLKELDVSAEVATKAVNYMLGLQSEDGSWYKSAYQTALAVNAVWGATVNPDLSIKTSDITFTPATVNSLPASIMVNANISNLGRTDVAQAKVVLYDGDMSSDKKIGEQVMTVPGQSSAIAQFPVAITDGSEHMFHVYVDPENLVQELNKTNNTALNSFKPASTYDFEMLASDITVSPGVVDIFKDVKVSSKVTNKGTLNAYNVQVRYYIDEAGGPFELATATVDIPANSTISNEITWRANKAGDNLPVTVLVDPFNNFTEVAKDNNKATAYLTVNGSTESNLTVSYKDMVITPSPANERGNANITAIVKNEGFSVASNIAVNCYRGVPGTDGVLIGSGSIPAINAGESRSVSFDWTNIAESGEKIIYIKVDPDNQITEVMENDNDAFVVLNILSLPDLALSTNSIVFMPSAPKDGDPVSITVTVQNKGQQEASNVTVRAYEGNTLIGSQVIQSITGNSFASASMTYNTAGKNGAHPITVVVDPDNAIVERSKDNNSASRTFGVQDSNLWVTEQYISPNGDGVKDSTQMFFSLDLSQTVKVIVVNESGETVRTFSGSEFENTPGGNIAWDGLNDKGTVAADGQYQIKVVGMNNNILGSLLVTVDNNRSPLTDAIGTEYLLKNNLTCKLYNMAKWDWMPNESGMIFSIGDVYRDDVTYTEGIYSMSPDGADIFRLIPPDWTHKNPDSQYYGFTYTVSPDGQKIVFSFRKVKTGSKDAYELWVMDSDGKGLTQLMNGLDPLDDVYWSPDSEYLAVAGQNIGVWIIKNAGLENNNIISDPNAYFYDFKWSPDGSKLAFVHGYYDNNWNYLEELKISDRSGLIQPIYNFNGWVSEIHWNGNERIVSLERDKQAWTKAVWLVDTSKNGNFKKISGKASYLSVSPDNKKVAYIDREKPNVVSIKYSGDASDNITLYEVPFVELTGDMMGEGNISNIVWSNDGERIAFIDRAYKKVEKCRYEQDLIIINTNTQAVSAQKLIDSSQSLDYECTYGPGGQHFNEEVLIRMFSWPAGDSDVLIESNRGLFNFNLDRGERGGYIPVKTNRWNPSVDARISPLGHYLSFFDNLDQTGTCYPQNNLWNISSLLNMTVDLRAIKDKSAVVLKGIASDLNFEGYSLEYADTNVPNSWNPVAPPSNVPVINDVFTTWVPPYEGTFNVRLTVWDKAGNEAMDIKRVSWGLSASVTNIYKTLEIFSPNGDAINDLVELHYNVLEPVHLEFYIYNEDEQLVTTISKSYTTPVGDYITWDGRDSAGNIVPDGKYKLRVFDYEFFVELDNTPPDVDLLVGQIGQDPATYMLYSDLKGHVVDNNLKSWVVEYGDGDNPMEWYEFREGTKQLIGKDKAGQPVLNPIKDDTVESFKQEGVAWLTGKSLRITAEDLAGNKSAAIETLQDERIIINEWDERFIYDTLTPLETWAGIHTIEGIKTIKRPLSGMNLQYTINGQWHDGAPASDIDSYVIKLLMDNSGLDANKGYAVRIKAVDMLGEEHYSNVFSTRPKFELNADCANQLLLYDIFLFEDLQSLKYSVRSAADDRYPEWTEYSVQNSTPGNPIVQGSYAAPLPENLIPGVNYDIKMTGTGISGKEYYSAGKYPFACKNELSLSVDYEKAECNSMSSKALLTLKFKDLSGFKGTLKALSYYIQKPEGRQLLGDFKISGNQIESLKLDTSSLTEGNYNVIAILQYVDTDNAVKEISAANTLVVDRVLPAAQITYPAKSAMVCPVKFSNSKGDWYGIPVEGIATDNNSIKQYNLYYGIGENPAVWMFSTVAGTAPVKGRLGNWDITKLKGTDFSLKLQVTDSAGNTSCQVTGLSVDTLIEILNLSTDKKLLSPNSDGLFDDVNVGYFVNEYAVVDVKTFKLPEEGGDFYVPDSIPVRTIVTGLQHSGGTENILWDGKDDSGTAVPDGRYGIAVFARDPCGNTAVKWTPVEVDNTQPEGTITYPGPLDPLGNIVEVKGTAWDLHFKSYSLEAGEGDNPGAWTTVSSGANAVEDGLLGKWNTSALIGRWTLRLSVVDTAGNNNISAVTVDLGARKNLIKDLSSTPKLFSPNNDGKLDSAIIKYELTDACLISIDISDSVGVLKKTYIFSTSSGGTYTYVWDGKDNAGAVVLDDAYTVKLSAALSYNLSVTQEEIITVIVDSTQPVIDIRKPVDNSYIRTEVTVNGNVSDKNLSEYSVAYTGDSGTVLLDSGNQSREGFVFGTLNEHPEGNYTLNIKAKDFAENANEKNIVFTIDRTSPKVILEAPRDDEYYGSDKNIINISGSIVEKNLEIFSLRYGLGDNPSQWMDLVSGNTVPANPQLLSWKVGKNDGIPDGLYALSLYAKDKVGLTGEVKVKIMIDNTQPEVAITAPADGHYIKAGSDINGTTNDPNLDKYTVEFSEGQCSSAFKWAIVKTSTATVNNGLLVKWQMVPPDGDYCVRLSAMDKSGNKAESKINVKVDTYPPSAPVLSGRIENKSVVKLTWPQNTETDVSGYDLYRDGQKVNVALIKGLDYSDQGLTEGTFTYTLKAVDFAGNESALSNEINLKVDLSAPEAKIASPRDGSRSGSLVDIKGTAYSSEDFKQYRVYIGQGQTPSSWSLIRTSPLTVTYGLLAQWDSIGLGGLYSIKLEAEDLSGNINLHQVTVTIDNTPPAAPSLVSAAPNSSDVTLTWQANAESDLAGYLLYRNDQLANVSGIMIGDLKPYLIAGTTYLDKALPDGKFKYYIMAMDQAGNLSDRSNSLEVNIDTHPPHVTIVAPADRAKVENKTLVKAESTDLDISAVQFQYKGTQDVSWINLGVPATQLPYTTYMDLKETGLPYGDYHIRAVATDTGGKTDTSPSYITITFTDITPPSTPLALKALTTGKDVTLTWTANTEPDLNGYNVYRTSKGTKTRVNLSIVKEAAYQDKDLADGEYAYEITAVDTFGNESKVSYMVSANIYVLLLTQPYTPIGQNPLQIKGSKAVVNTAVEISVDSGSGPVFQDSATPDSQGSFEYELLLSQGENRITAKAVDSSGNTSRVSNMVVVVYNEPPATPTGLAASVENYNVNLAWNANTEPDLSGYNIYRNGEKVNAPIPVTSGTVTVSSSYYNPPSYAFDGNPGTYWESPYSYGPFNPLWWELDLPSAELINQVEVRWGSGADYQGNAILYAGKDFEIQVWSGYAWITQVKAAGNSSIDNNFDFNPSYRTNKVRLYITDTADPNSSKQVRISEVSILRDTHVTQPSYADVNLPDHNYNYKVAAVDYYGFESPLSGAAEAAVGDVFPPSVPLSLTAAASDSNVALNWNANAEPDLKGYNVYRKTQNGWIKLNAAIVTTNAYTDFNLKNGAYTYRVAAMDEAGNEGSPSNEASADVYVLPPDTLPQSVPVIYFPTVSGMPIISIKDKTDISGSGAPGSVVELFRDSVSLGKTTAIMAEGVQSYSLDDGIRTYNISISPDGKKLAYVLEGSLWINDLNSGNKIRVMQNSYFSVWSPDSTKLAYDFEDDLENTHIGIYDVDTASTTLLTEDSGVNELHPPWSSDGNRVAFGSDRSGSMDIWVKDFVTGADIQVTSGVEFYDVQLSPDGNKVAYSAYNENTECVDVYLTDINTKKVSLVDASCSEEPSFYWSPDSNILSLDIYNEDEDSVIVLFDSGSGNQPRITLPGSGGVWSPDGGRLAFSYAGIIVFDIKTGLQTQITTPGYDDYSPVWSPDGKFIAFERWVSYGHNSIMVTKSDAQGQERALNQNLSGYEYFAWTKAGDVVYTDKNTLNLTHYGGYFNFKDVQLDLGGNLFYTVAADSLGSVSQPSDAISVTFSTNLMPDFEITADDIFVYPQYPKPGEEAAIYVTVRNKGGVDATDVEADIYLLDVEGNLGLVRSAIISYIATASSEVVGINLNGLKIGDNKFFAVIDPQDKIKELDESNNYAENEFVVGNLEGVLISTVLDSDWYSADNAVTVAVSLDNAGIEKDGTLTIVVEDSDGYAVALLYSADMSIPYAFHKDMELSWNTGNTFAGQYRVHAALKDASGIIAETVIPFTIKPDLDMNLSLVSDKGNYAAFEDVSFEVMLRNSGRNYIVPELNAKIKITDSNHNILATDDRILTDLMPNVSNALISTWNAGPHPPGIYNASVELYIDNGLVSTKTTAFTIAPTFIITGEMTVAPAVVTHGNTVRIGYQVRNSGNTGISSLPLKVLVIDAESGAVINMGENMTDLAVNGSQAGEFIFSTNGYGLKSYRASLQCLYQGDAKNIASAFFVVKDGIPPTLNIISPVPGNYYNSKLEISAAASDDISGVERVEYQTDNGAWRLLPVSNSATGRYSASWVPTKTDEGPKTIGFRATDKAGNISQPVSVPFVIDLTPPLPPVITSPQDNSTVTADVVDINGSSEPGSAVMMVSSNAMEIKSGPDSGEFIFEGVLLALGENVIAFTASDIAGNVSGPGTLTINFMPLAAGISAGRIKYSPYEDVAITSNIRNISSEYTLQGLSAKISLFDGLGQTVLVDEKEVLELAPGQFSELMTYWNTSTSPKGIYSVKLEILKDSIIQHGSSTTFEVLGSSQTGEGLTGAIMAQPDPVSQGKDETITYSITNKGNEDIDALEVKVLIINPDTQEIENAFNNNINLPMDTTITGSFVSNTSNLAPRIYSVALQISTASMVKPKEAATAVFEVKPGLEITKTIPDVINMLVWLNGKCHVQSEDRDSDKVKHSPTEYAARGCQNQDDDDKRCARIDLLEKVLMESAGDYFIVYNKKDFQAELRNPYYTDILILGDHSRLDDRFEDELRERVYSGTGLISSLWLNYGESKDRIFGVKYKGKLSGADHIVNTVPSPVTANGVIYAKGDAERVETMDGTTIAAWLKKVREYKHFKKDEFYPAIVLNEYGNGRTIYYTFDWGLTLDDTNYNSLADMIKNSIVYVHRPKRTTTFYPNSFVPFDMQFKDSGGAFDLTIKESYPEELKLYDPKAGEWITDNPWVMNIRLEPNGPNNLRFYVFTPDKAGTYTLQTEAGYMDNGAYSFGQNLGADITISKDAVTAASDAITALNELTAFGKDRAKINDAIRYIKTVQKRIIVNNKDIEKNIRDILKAIEALFSVTGTDVSATRLMLDELLRIWEGAGGHL